MDTNDSLCAGKKKFKKGTQKSRHISQIMQIKNAFPRVSSQKKRMSRRKALGKIYISSGYKLSASCADENVNLFQMKPSAQK